MATLKDFDHYTIQYTSAEHNRKLMKGEMPYFFHETLGYWHFHGFIGEVMVVENSHKSIEDLVSRVEKQIDAL